VTKPRDVLRGLGRLGSDLGVALAPIDHDAVLEAICEAAQVAFGARACSIAVFDPESGELVFAAATGSAATSVVGMRLPVKRGIAGYAVASGQAIAVHDVERDPRFDREAAEATGYIPRSILAVPIETTDGVSGVIEVLDWSDERVGEEGLELAGVFARQAGLALQQADLFGNLGRMILLAAGQAAKSENPDLTRSLRTVADRVDGPTGELAEIAACFSEIASLGVVERRAALALLDDFTTYARRQSRRR
jgi:GAF domain-containing protein